MRIVAVIAAWLAAGALNAATLHVATPGGCPNHANVAAQCSTSASCGSLASPCCSVEIADGPAVPGDVIEVHHGVYTGSVTIGSLTFAAGIDTPNVTIRAASGDTPILDGQGIVRGCIHTTQDNVTVDGITCRSQICGTESQRTGVIHAHGSSGSRFRNMTLNVALPAGQGEFACGAFRLTGSGSGNTIIENNTISGYMGHTFFVEDHSGSDGVVIRNNTVRLDGASSPNDPYRVLAVKGSSVNTPVAFYNNRVTRTAQMNAAGAAVFMREIPAEGRVYVFNNVCVDCGSQYSVYTQDNSCPPQGVFWDQNVDIFNNTFTGRGSSVDWQNYWSRMRVQNNIFDGASTGVRGGASASEGCSHTDSLWSAATDRFTDNIVENSGGSMYSGIADSTTVSSLGSTIGNSASTSRDPNHNLTASTRPGNNDPLGQGPGLCSISLAGQTINCALDINGTPRGLTWDIGADQFTAGAPSSCGNGTIESGESCDGSALGGATCSSLGYPGGTLGCKSDCTFDVSGCEGSAAANITFTDVSSAVVGSWVTINGRGFGSSQGSGQVLFGAVAATSIPVWTDSRIIAQVPSGAGSPLTVRTAGGDSNSVPMAYHSGRILWVSKSGSDSNGCTSQTSPCLTVNRARTVAVAGDVVVIRNGSYCESSGGAGLYVRSSNSGTAAQPITYRGYPGEFPTIDCCGTCGGSTVYLEGNFIQVSGIAATGARGTGIVIVGNSNRVSNCEAFGNNQAGYAATSGSGVNVQNGSSNAKVLGCSIHDNGSVDNLDHGMYLKGQDMEIGYNNVYNHPLGYGIQLYEGSGATFSGARVHGNLIYANRNAGITIHQGAVNAEVFNNEIRHNVRHGIYVGGSGGSAPSGTRILNNTIHDNDSSNVGYHQLRIQTGSSTTAKNNVITGSNGLMIRRDSTASGGTIDFNQYGSNASNSFNWNGTSYNFSGWRSASGQDGQSGTGDPFYVNASSNDLRLGAGSPALDTAEAASSPASDRHGKPRPVAAGPDRGAYEAGVGGGSGGTRPSTVPNVTRTDKR